MPIACKKPGKTRRAKIRVASTEDLEALEIKMRDDAMQRRARIDALQRRMQHGL